MRHLTGIVLAVVMTAALFCAATWGYVRFLAQSSGLSAGVADPVATVTAGVPPAWPGGPGPGVSG
jgi:hypothetical protein